MKILIADKFSEDHLQQMQNMGHEVTLRPELGPSDLPEAVPGYEALVVRSTLVTAETLEGLIALAEEMTDVLELKQG